jgi:hypothetical protein
LRFFTDILIAGKADLRIGTLVVSPFEDGSLRKRRNVTAEFSAEE